MFLGHFGLAMMGKRWKRDVSLGALIFASAWADLLWPLLLLAGVERVAIAPGHTAFNSIAFTSYPWSHSLLLEVVWGVALGALYYGWKRDLPAALLVGALVPSHWVLHLVVHAADLPIWPGGPLVGLGLWNSIPGTLVVEFGLLAVGAAAYLTATRATGRIGTWGAYGFVALLAAIYLGLSFGPPPTDPTALAYGSLALWIVPPLAYWIDARRDARPPADARGTNAPTAPRGN